MNQIAVLPRASFRLLRRKLVLGTLATMLALGGAILMGEGLYIKAKASLAQVLLERAWERTLEGDEQVKPWAWADTWPVARIEVPRLKASTIVLNGVSGQAMAFGPGLMIAGPQPGDPGLAVISAHRDTHFRFLKDIEIGDQVRVTTAAGAAHVFEITETRIVEAAASGLSFTQDEPLIALVTCWPFEALQQGSKRFVAIGAPVRMGPSDTRLPSNQAITKPGTAS